MMVSDKICLVINQQLNLDQLQDMMITGIDSMMADMNLNQDFSGAQDI